MPNCGACGEPEGHCSYKHFHKRIIRYNAYCYNGLAYLFIWCLLIAHSYIKIAPLLFMFWIPCGSGSHWKFYRRIDFWQKSFTVSLYRFYIKNHYIELNLYITKSPNFIIVWFTHYIVGSLYWAPTVTWIFLQNNY